MICVKLQTIFDVIIGKSNDLNKLCPLDKNDPSAIKCVGRTFDNNGVVEWVNKSSVSKVYSGIVITVPMVGNSTCMATIQNGDFCVTQNVAILKPKIELTINEIFYYTQCIRYNKNRFCYGRPLSLKTTKDLLIPSFGLIPSWVNKAKTDSKNYGASINKSVLSLNNCNWSWFNIIDLFDVERGKIDRSKKSDVLIPIISATTINNGIMDYGKIKAQHIGNVLTITADGECGIVFYQEKPFSGQSINVLIPRFEMNKYSAMFFCGILQKIKMKYNYGRKMSYERIVLEKIKLPTTIDNKPDFNFMEKYIKTLRYSANI